MWLGESDNQVENSRRASRLSISRAGKPSQIDILTIWLEISLVREFKESCSFSPRVYTYSDVGQTPGNDEDTSTEDNCEATENKANTVLETSQSNIPFRRDNVECLFVL
jgi:hypothetical protein